MRGFEALFQGARGPTTPTRRHAGSAARTLTLLVGALSLMLSACSGGLGGTGGNNQLAADQTFIWPYVDAAGVFGHNEILDPAEDASLKDAGSLSMLNIGLVTYKPDLTVQGDAATRWDIDPTGTIYTFHLRPNLSFSDGKPITAADFAFSIDRAVDPKLCPVYSAATYYSPDPNKNSCVQEGANYLTHILGANDRLAGTNSTLISEGDDPRKGLNVLDAQTLRIRLDAPVSFFLEALTYPDADVLEKSFVTSPNNLSGGWVDHLDTGGTSGPFKLKSYGNSTKMTFVPNTYWEKAFGQQLTLTQVVRPVVSSEDNEYSNYRAGAYDFTDVPTAQYSFARGQSDFHSVPGLETDYFGMNFKQPPFDNLQVRQAFDLALNKQLLVDRVENGGAIPTNHIVPQGMPGFDVSLTNPKSDGTQSLTGNQTAATALLKQAQATCPAPGTFGAPDYCPFISAAPGSTPLEIDLYVPEESSSRVQIGQLAAQQWSNSLGLNIKAKPVSFDRIVGFITTPAAQDPASIWEIGWIADYPDPQDWLTLQFSTNAPYNASGLSNASLDAQMKTADVERDAVKRMQDYNAIEQAVIEQCAWIPYQQTKVYWRQRDFVHGFGFNAIGLMVDVNWPKVYIAKQ